MINYRWRTTTCVSVPEITSLVVCVHAGPRGVDPKRSFMRVGAPALFEVTFMPV